MNKEQLMKEHDICKKNVIKFSVLTGIFILLAITFYVLFIVFSILTETVEDPYYMITGFLAIASLIIFIITVPAPDIFIPFLIINAVKLGKRNNLLNEMKKEETIVVE